MCIQMFKTYVYVITYLMVQTSTPIFLLFSNEGYFGNKSKDRSKKMSLMGILFRERCFQSYLIKIFVKNSLQSWLQHIQHELGLNGSCGNIITIDVSCVNSKVVRFLVQIWMSHSFLYGLFMYLFISSMFVVGQHKRRLHFFTSFRSFEKLYLPRFQVRWWMKGVGLGV